MLLLDMLGGLLLVATVLSCVPQYVRISRLRSTTGVSLLASFLKTLAAQMQLVTMYYIFRNHSLEWEYGKIIGTPPTIQDWLVLTQIVVQWACSLILFAHVVAYLPHDPRTEYRPGRRILSSGQIAATLLALHAVFAVAFMVVAGKPAKYLDNVVFIFIMAFNTAIAMPIATILTVAACSLQASRSSKVIATSKSSHTSSANALSRKSVVLQMFNFLALAISWPFRFEMPSKLSGGPEDGWQWTAYQWYPNVGWPCVNNAIIAIWQYVVLYIMAGGDARGDLSLTGERQALLSS